MLVVGNSAAWSGDLAIAHDVMADAIDAAAFARALAAAGLVPSVPLAPAEQARLVAVLAKADAAHSGTIRGARHTMLDDSDIPASRHARALVGGVLAALAGTTRLFVSGGAEHQGPDGGGPVAAIVRRRALTPRWGAARRCGHARGHDIRRRGEGGTPHPERAAGRRGGARARRLRGLPGDRGADAVRALRRVAPAAPAVLRADVPARLHRVRLFQPAGGGADGDLHRHGAGACSPRPGWRGSRPRRRCRVWWCCRSRANSGRCWPG